MAPQRSTSMNRMWFDWRETFPNTETAQDGWIGDLAHAQGTSGHNPDDTPGVSAERQDADSKQEVRAIDKDVRLNKPGVSMEMVVQRMLQTPNDLKRLIYIIFNKRIWKKSNNWKQETYTGNDPHDLHAHFSGDQNYDEDGASWLSITYFKSGAVNDMTTLDSIHDPAWNEPPAGDGDPRSIARLIWETWDMDHTTFFDVANNFPKSLPAYLVKMKGQQDEILAKLAEQDAKLDQIIDLLNAIAAGGGAGGVSPTAARAIARDEIAASRVMPSDV